MFSFFKENPLFKTTEIGSYPSYHSSYELFELVEKFLDPNYEVKTTYL